MLKSIYPFIFCILTAFLAGCLGLPSLELPARPIAVPALSASAKESLLVFLPGLNTRSSAFEPLAHELAQLGYSAEILNLESNAKGYSANELIEQLSTELKELRRKFPTKPVVLIGYSLGALIATNYAATYRPDFVKALILLAPAQGMHLRNYLIYPATWFAWTGLGLRSFAPEKHRARSVTSLKSYAALFELHHRAYRLKSEWLMQHPGLMVVNDDDELVSPLRSKNWLERNSLSHWHFHELKDVQESHDAPQHLLIHPDGVGFPAWSNMRDLIIQFLKTLDTQG